MFWFNSSVCPKRHSKKGQGRKHALSFSSKLLKRQIKHLSCKKVLSKGTYELTVSCSKDLDHMGLILELLDGMARWCSTAQCGLQDWNTHWALDLFTNLHKTPNWKHKSSLPKRGILVLSENNSRSPKPNASFFQLNNVPVSEKKAPWWNFRCDAFLNVFSQLCLH